MQRLIAAFLLGAASVGCSRTASIVVEANSPVVTGSELGESIGLETLGGVFTVLLQQGCELPCEKTEVFSTAEDNQTEIQIFLARGSASRAAENHSLGAFAILGLPPLPRGQPSVRVTIRARNGRITLTARDDAGAPIRIEHRERAA